MAIRMRGMPDMKRIEKKLVELQDRKDRVLSLSRDIVRLAGRGITLMHARKLGAAKVCIKQMGSLIKKLGNAEKGFEYFSIQARQEYVEARAFYAILKERRLVSQSELHVDEIPYLLGMMDLTGELKREAIEAIRRDEIEAANAYYALMKSIYDSTRAMRFANSLVPEFRRKQDTARIQMESAASELLSAVGRKRYR